MKKNLFIFTGSRADYGILKNLVIDLKKEKNIVTKLVVGGSHFSKKYGYSIQEIIKDRIKVSHKISLKIQNTRDIDIVNFISKSINKYGKVLKKYNPDYVLLLGDRFETFSFAIACYFLNIKIIHIHGGEVTSGSFDDNIRHCITKMSNYHFVSHQSHLKRLIQLGENRKQIFNIGSLGVQNFIESKKDSKKNFLNKFKLPENYKLALVTFHPETQSKTDYKIQIHTFLSSLKKYKNIYYIFTYNNNDTFGAYFIKQIQKYKYANRNSRIYKSMGSSMYFNFLNNVDIVIGNSSSGIIEAPSANTITLNVGTRQEGRIFSKSVFGCPLSQKGIHSSLDKILKIKKKNFQNVYYKKNTRQNLIKILKNDIFKKKLEIKKFNDLKFKY